MPSPDDTKTEVLKAAIRLIAPGGLQAVTHRAVEEEAGVTHGTTTYYFGNKQKMMEAVFEFIAQHDSDLAGGGTAEPPPEMPRSYNDPLIRRVLNLTEGDRIYTIARYELMLEVVRRPTLRSEFLRQRLLFVGVAKTMLSELGAKNPDLAARWWIAALDGILLDELCAQTVVLAENAQVIMEATITAALLIR